MESQAAEVTSSYPENSQEKTVLNFGRMLNQDVHVAHPFIKHYNILNV